MIIFEDRLAELVGTMPKLTLNNIEYQINFDWGTETKLAQYLALNGKLSFPLIWLAENEDINNEREPSVKRNARLVILNESQKPDQFNPYLHKYDYDKVLQPILDNLLIGLKQSGFTRFNDKSFKTRRVKEYSMRNESESLIYICNAIVLDAEITITDGCLQFIKYNN